MSETWLHAQSTVATGIYNLDSARRRNASLDKRTEGWTEVWGQDIAQEKNDWSYEEETVISRALSTLYPQMPITIVQHRPAWFEQVILRFSDVPHIVVNSPYVATEATGPLPYLRHLCEPRVLVGRHNPTTCTGDSKNCILDYLQSQGYVTLDKELSLSQKSLSNAYTALITSHLEQALLSLRFGDKHAWDQVYRQQYIQTSKNGRTGYLPPLGSWFQAWCVRTVTLKQLHTVKSVQESISMAREAYQSLETQLNGNNYLLHTDSPTTVDALLWAHLADALCDVHLVTILADFPSLVQYFSRTYNAYFRLDSTSGAEWKVWNQQQNLSSPFQQLPLEETLSNEPTTFHDALELMQSLSVHTHDLQEVLAVAQEQRQQECKCRSVPKQQSTLYRWRMGGDLLPPKQESPDAEETPLQEQYRKVHKRNDELWLSSVLAITAIAVFFGATMRNGQ